MRTHISRTLGIAAQDIDLSEAPGQRPKLAGGKLNLGLSHSGGMCLLVCAEGIQVGCDVELQRPRKRLLALARHYFHQQEAACLENRNQVDQTTDFYRLWTLKEAGHKALGQGIGQGLSTPAFKLQPTLECLAAAGPGAWTYAAATTSSAGKNYSVALAASATPITLEVRQYGNADGHVADQALHLNWEIATVTN